MRAFPNSYGLARKATVHNAVPYSSMICCQHCWMGRGDDVRPSELADEFHVAIPGIGPHRCFMDCTLLAHGKTNSVRVDLALAHLNPKTLNPKT
jgi:hypothetical protein